jgi:hypothetical protein
MKTRVSLLSMILGAPLFLVAAPAFMTGACGSSGGSGGGTGTAGTSGGGGLPPADQLLSDFEDPAAATVVMVNGRNGYWYSYNDAAATCVQMPANMAAYIGSAPPMAAPSGGTQALHAQWTGCSTWGAGVGADLAQPAQDGGMYTGPKVPYADLSNYTGITFWAMSATTADNKLRVKLPMTDETKIADGGLCDEAVVGMNKCSDDYGQAFSLPTNGTWTQITVMFSDTTKFKQEGWGHAFPWMPGHVTSIQIQSQGSETGQTYDFWVDNVYLLK